eukprot:s3702_g5.t1
MEVFRISGERLAVLDPHEFEGKPAKAVKEALAPKVGINRFKQRFLAEASSRQIPDDEVFASAPLRVQLVVLDFWPPSVERSQQMISASRDNDVVALEELLNCPLNPNVFDEDGDTALYNAADMGHVGPVLLLLEAEADPDKCEIGGRTPLWIAAEKGHLEIVRELVAVGADKDLADSDGATPLSMAARRGNLDIVRVLVNAGAAKDQADSDGATPLFMAAFAGHPEIVRFLVEAGSQRSSDKQWFNTLDDCSGWADACHVPAAQGELHELSCTSRRFSMVERGYSWGSRGSTIEL